MASVPGKGPAPVVFNERLAQHLRDLEAGAESLAARTISLEKRLDDHTRNDNVSAVVVLNFRNPLRRGAR